MDGGRGRGQTEERQRKRQQEETQRKVLETEQASMSRVSTAGSEVLMTGSERASGKAHVGKCVHRWMSLAETACFYAFEFVIFKTQRGE